MLNKLRNIFRPEIFQGNGRTDNYFEGWFYKVIDKPGDNIYAIIPGIFRSNDPEKNHSFIQVHDGRNKKSEYFSFPADAFKAHKKKLRLDIAGNIFEANKMLLNLKGDKFIVKGELDFSDLKPWPKTPRSPGIMGWYAYVPFMECNHCVVSLDHIVTGNLEINDHNIDFTNGRGYIEKDWGSSFPSSYVWLQSNHFSREGVSFIGSVANIPWLKSSFRGFIIGLLTPEKLYKFATYNSSELDFLKIDDAYVHFQVHNKKYTMEVRAIRTGGAKLHAPYDNIMTERVTESLFSRISIKLTDKKGEVIFEDEGQNAGLEVNGNLEEILG